MKTETQPAQSPSIDLRKVDLKELLDLCEEMANYDCFQPWGVICENCESGEKPCEPCRAKFILAKLEDK